MRNDITHKSVRLACTYSHCSKMAVENFTVEENQKTRQELMCSAEITGQEHNHLIFISALNIFLSITAFLGNTLILVALHKKSSLYPPSKLLYRSLATTDLCVGIIVEPHAVIYWMSVVTEQWNLCRYAINSSFITAYILCSVSLLTLTAISVDRLFALLIGLKYRQVVTLKRTYLAVIAFWVVSSVAATMYFWNPLITLWYGNIGTIMCLATSIFSYTKIFLTLRHHQNKVQNHTPQKKPSQTMPLNIARYRKAVYSALWVQVTLVVCYLPHFIVKALTPQRGLPFSIYLARKYTVTLVYLNSSLNPLLYCWKIREVRQAVKDTIRQLRCSST